MITLRPVTPADRPFLLAVYASTRADELALVNWSSDQKTAFVAHQFNAQDTDYRRRFPQAMFSVVEHEGQPIGRLYTIVLDTELLVLDIALLPQWRGRHIGTALLQDVIATGDELGLPVQLHVERWNAARSLYERLGFSVVGEDDVYLLMERPVSAELSTDASASSVS